ncbi:MBOAT family O-acyltransferase [Desulfolithobacter dissulfuricans]|uniref:MBOAT family O-acyltransferase n=1 Tax=Desulfolithobacter dissulfuricans TaxID=2795293 RepID=UPI00227901CC|nr:MBOAT family O-acyltransferase [Desulfolithobacter dissulfuricans]
MTITPYAGTIFWLITVIFIACYTVFQRTQASLLTRNCFMISVSLLVISLAVSNSSVLIPLLLALTAIVYFTGRYLAENKGIKKNRIITVVIVMIILFLCYFKYSIIQSFFNNLLQGGLPLSASGQHIFFIGVSYFSFKFIHFLVESRNGKIHDLNLLTFINYTLFFPSFFSGPINRYTAFAESIATGSDLRRNLLKGIQRIITGLFKKIVLGDSLYPFSIAALDISTARQTDIVIGVYAYMLYIYFNFSGYTDMAIGCGRMVGIDLPENFNYPFFKRNLQQFWANWHMSLTTWLTDYIYWPLARKFRNIQKLRKKPVTISNICIVITFLVCGLWHGDGLNFILWGLYHGIGLAILNGYTHFIKKHTSRNIKKFVHNSPVAYGISNIITFQYVALGFLLFACDMEKLSRISSLFF